MEENKSLIENATLIAERTEKAAASAKAEADRIENLMARQALGGRSVSTNTTEEPKVETPKEYAQRLMRNNL